MIVPMRQIILFLLGPQRKDVVLKLAKLGVVHLRKDFWHLPVGKLEDNFHMAKQADAFLAGLKNPISQRSKNIEGKNAFDSSKIEQIILDINKLFSDKQEKQKLLKQVEIKLHWYEIWGKVSLATIKKIADYGFYLYLWKGPVKEIKKLKEQDYFFPLYTQGKTVTGLLCLRTKEIFLNGEIIPWPQHSYEELIEDKKKLIEKINILEKEANKYYPYKKAIEEYIRSLEKIIVLEKATNSLEEYGQVCVLQGYIPEREEDKIIKFAEKNKWGILTKQPDNPEEVPTLLENKYPARFTHPIFSFMETLPGYQEVDVSFWFLIFFTIFFAMIVGDGGYGLLFLLFTWAISKTKKIKKEISGLLYLLSFTTIIWGAVTGTWFGWEGFLNWPILRQLVINPLNSFNPLSQGVIIRICFIIGMVHLSLAHIIYALNKKSFSLLISQLGWVMIAWAMFFLTNNLVMAESLPKLFNWFLITGVSFIIFFSNTKPNIFLGALKTLANLPLKLVNFFADILSYLRLFAVGYASVMVASSFNQMAGQLGSNSLLGLFFSALILFFGHLLNIVLSLMSVLVHGIRLNMLEFSSHLNMEWKGKAYKPLKEEYSS